MLLFANLLNGLDTLLAHTVVQEVDRLCLDDAVPLSAEEHLARLEECLLSSPSNAIPRWPEGQAACNGSHPPRRFKEQRALSLTHTTRSGVERALSRKATLVAANPALLHGRPADAAETGSNR